MSLAYGASGIALFLHRTAGTLPDELKAWLLDRPLDVGTYPPSLFVGLSGIAVAFWEMGFHEKAEEVMRATYESPLLYDQAGICQGAAGWGWASLYFWDRTRRGLYLDQAVRAGEHLLRTAETEGDTLFWRHAGDGNMVHYGYGFGSAGIGLFLLYLGARTSRRDFLDSAGKGLEYDLAHRLDTSNGVSWRRYEDDPVNYPYFVHGGAGIGSIALRFAHLLGSDRYRAVAEEISDAVYIKWSVFPNLLTGMSGIAEFALDMYRFTGDEKYLDRAYDQAETVLWFRIRTPLGTAFPGRMLLKICNDWATGSAGIGLFLHRLQNPGPRLLLDLDSPEVSL
jgi:hypothetical protein